MAWQLDGSHATLTSKSFAAKFDLAHPYLGLTLESPEKCVVASQLFAFLVPDTPVDSYVRGNDLVNKYGPRNSDLVSYQTYYRMTDDGEGIECILSAQTSLLDSAPLTQLTCSFENATLAMTLATNESCQAVEGEIALDLKDAPRLFLIRPNDSPHSWVLWIHPSDFHRGLARSTPSPSVAFHVFPESLEKGVIRRARLRLQRIPRVDDTQHANDLLDSLLAAAPPLAT